MKKQIRFISILVVMILSVFVLSGCNSKEKSEELIRTSLIEELDSIKNQDEELMTEYEQSIGVAQFEEMGIDAGDFMSEYLNGFDYTIGDITVEDEKATANVVLKCKSISNFEARLQDASQALFDDMEALSQLSEEELNAKIAEMVMQTVSELELKETDPIAIEYELIDNTWTPTEESQNDISNALLAN